MKRVNIRWLGCIALVFIFLLGFSQASRAFDIPGGLTGLEEGGLTQYKNKQYVNYWANKVCNGVYGPCGNEREKLEAISNLIRDKDVIDAEKVPETEDGHCATKCCTKECDRFSLNAEQLLSPGYRCFSGCTQFGIMFVAIARALNVKVLYVGTTREDKIEELQNGIKDPPYDGHFFATFYNPSKERWILFNPTSGRVVGEEVDPKSGYTVKTSGPFSSAYDPATGKGLYINWPRPKDNTSVTYVSHAIAVDPYEIGIRNVESHRNNIASIWLKPNRFFIDFKDAYMVYVPANGTKQIYAEGVLSYGGDWQVSKIQPYLYHMRLKTWKDFYWAVNTSRKEVYKVTGGTFGQSGGSAKKKNFTVEVIGGGGTGTPDRFMIKFTDSYLVYVPATEVIQIAAGGNVLSYGSDWEALRSHRDVYHLRLKTWDNFFWKVNTNNKKAFKVRNGNFGNKNEGGTKEKLKSTVRVVQ